MNAGTGHTRFGDFLIEQRENELFADEITELTLLYQKIFNGVYPNNPKDYEKCHETVLCWLQEKPQLFLVKYANKLIGFMMLAENMVDQLYIDIPFRGKKLGKQLIQIAKDMYPEKLALFTLKENKNAIAFYERQGFKIIRYGIAPDEGIPDVYMEWSAE